MSKDTETKIVSVKLEESLVNKADYLAKKASISRQRLCTNVLNIGIEEAADDPLTFHFGTLLNEFRKKVIKAKLQQKENDRLIILALKIKEENFTKLDVIASNWSSTRHDVTKKIIINGIEGLMTIDAVGLVTPLMKLKDIAKVFQNLCKKGQAAYKEIEDEEFNR